MSPGKATKYGHRKVYLENEGHWVHRLVLRAFVGEPVGGQLARHLDGNPENNRVSNLAWGTPADNGEDAARHGSQRGSSNPRSKLTEQDVYAIRALHHVAPADYVARLFHLKPNTIAQLWCDGGKTWRWLD